MNIFNKESFTLKELCLMFKTLNNYDINNISDCYLYFSNNDLNYINFLRYVRFNKYYIVINNKNYNYIELLQLFDIDFTKLVIRIKTIPRIYDIHITWINFEKQTGIYKDDLENYINNYK